MRPELEYADLKGGKLYRMTANFGGCLRQMVILN